MIEKINRKIHNLSSKPQEQLHKHSPARNALERPTHRVVSWDPAGGAAHQPRILPPWTRQQWVSSSSWEQLVLGRAQGPRTQEEGNVLSDCHQKSPPTSSLILRGIHHRKTDPSSSFHLFPSARKQKRQNLNYTDQLHSGMTKQCQKANSIKDRK